MGGHLLPDLMVANQDVTIWIDPLDATKEYTGIFTNKQLKPGL
jgi:Inositol monophosphatase family